MKLFDVQEYVEKKKNKENVAKPMTKAKKRAKANKTGLQILTLKYFFDRMEEESENKDNSKLVNEVCNVTGFTRRQIYKWIWDETYRKKTRSKEMNEKLDIQVKEAFTDIKKTYEREILNRQGMVLTGIYIPSDKRLNVKNNNAVMRMKLHGLLDQSIFLRSKGIGKENQKKG